MTTTTAPPDGRGGYRSSFGSGDGLRKRRYGNLLNLGPPLTMIRENNFALLFLPLLFRPFRFLKPQSRFSSCPSTGSFSRALRFCSVATTGTVTGSWMRAYRSLHHPPCWYCQTMLACFSCLPPPWSQNTRPCTVRMIP